jgi:hypothetical protein
MQPTISPNPVKTQSIKPERRARKTSRRAAALGHVHFESDGRSAIRQSLRSLRQSLISYQTGPASGLQADFISSKALAWCELMESSLRKAGILPAIEVRQ